MTINAYYPGWQSIFDWTVYVGFGICFILAFGMGANDCANSYGTVVGAKVLRIWQAYILASVFETLGAALLGYKVTSTIKSGIVDLSIYSVYVANNQTDWIEVTNCSNNTIDQQPYLTNCTELSRAEFYLGELGALSGTAFWLLVAVLFSMPVSATQSVVGATVGFTLVFHGFTGIYYAELISIVISWITSPLLAGIFSVTFYFMIKFSVFKRERPLEASLNTAPFWFWLTLTVNTFTVFYNGSKYLGFDKLLWWHALLISNFIGLLAAAIVGFCGRNWIKKAALKLHAVDQRANVPAEDWVDSVRKSGKKKQILEINQDFHREYPEDTSVAVRGRFSNVGQLGPPAADMLEMTQTIEKINDDVITTEKNGPIHTEQDRTAVCIVNESMSFKDYLLYNIRRITKPVDEEPRAVKVFNYLQILSACFLAFSHGSNDTANSVGPLVGLYVAHKYGLATVDMSSGNHSDMEYIILFGAGSMLIGLWLMGHRVIKTIGRDLTEVTAPSGFAMTLGTAFTVLFASKVGIPVSTTHCMVGAVVFVGMARSQSEGVSWKLFRNIAFSWLVTTPIAGAVSALVAWLLAHFILKNR